MIKFKKHFKKWNIWRKSNTNSKIHKLLVLIKVVHSPTFEFMIYNDLNNNEKMKEVTCKVVKKGICKCKVSKEEFKEGEFYKYEIIAYSDSELMTVITATENNFAMQSSLESWKYYFEIEGGLKL